MHHNDLVMNIWPHINAEACMFLLLFISCASVPFVLLLAVSPVLTAQQLSEDTLRGVGRQQACGMEHGIKING